MMLMLWDKISRPEDLKNVCLTCKELREVATPSLYRRMLLFIGGQKDLRISAMLGRDNPGIPHIRKIYLEFEKTFVTKQQALEDSSDEESIPVVEDVSVATRQAQFTVRLLLDFLPVNILEVFRYFPFICAYFFFPSKLHFVSRNYFPVVF